MLSIPKNVAAANVEPLPENESNILCCWIDLLSFLFGFLLGYFFGIVIILQLKSSKFLNLRIFLKKPCLDDRIAAAVAMTLRNMNLIIAQNRTSFREYNIEVKSRCFEAHRLVQVQEMYKLPSKKAQKRGSRSLSFPLKNLLIFQCLRLT